MHSKHVAIAGAASQSSHYRTARALVMLRSSEPPLGRALDPDATTERQ